MLWSESPELQTSLSKDPDSESVEVTYLDNDLRLSRGQGGTAVKNVKYSEVL